MERYPVAYIRRSYADATSTGDVSREVQEAAIRDLAHRDGHNGDVEYFVDWGKSASEAKSKARTRYADMVKAIEGGKVSTVYAYALDRLNRSLLMSARFAKACEKHDVRIVTHREGEVRQDSPAEWLRWTILATFGEYELRTITLRNQNANAERKAKGGWVGRVGYGYRLERNDGGTVVRVPDPTADVERVVTAVRDAGSILGGCKLLNERQVPRPDGSVPQPDGTNNWGNTTLRRLVEQHAPDLIPAAGPTGRRQPTRRGPTGQPSMFAQLLLCHCGHVLTPEPGRKAYRCMNGNRVGRDVHGPAHVTERRILPWVKAEAARLDVNLALQYHVDPAERRRLEDAKRHATTAFVNGGYPSEDEYLADLARIKADLAKLDSMDSATMVPTAIDWDWPADAINHGLRSIWKAINLGPDMRPVEADWRVKEWRRA